jgi:hypothetical protein
VSAKTSIALVELAHVGADAGDDPGQLVRGDCGQTIEGPGQLVTRERCGPDANERLACSRLRHEELLEPQAVLV